MILIDANLLLYAVLRETPQHERARAWLEGQLNGAGGVGLPWESLTAFLRIATNGRIFPRPMSAADAWATVEEWLALDNVWTPGPVVAHAEILGRLIRQTAATAKRVPDAHLAAIAIGHGLTLASADVDFRVFPGLAYLNPI